MTDFFNSQIEDAKQSASASKTAALTTTNVDILTNSLNKVGKGQKVNLTYNNEGQIASITKDIVSPIQTALQKNHEEIAIWNARKAANTTASKLGLPLPFPDIGAPPAPVKKGK
jgi:hypothetical protein